MNWLKVVTVKVDNPKIGKNNNLTILHISDLHSNHTAKMNLNIWKKINELQFDMVVITGDIIQKKAIQLRPHLSYLSALAKRTKVYFVGGNHDSWDFYAMREMLKKTGVIVLDNEARTVFMNEEKIHTSCYSEKHCDKSDNERAFPINIVGFNDYYQLEGYHFQNLYQHLDQKFFTLTLSHQPQLFDKIYPFSDLTLCGHTHGGQVRFPLLPTLYAPGQGLFPKYSHGLFMKNDSKMFISKGIGATFFNIRFYNRPEIALIRISGV